ncbi:HEAT repeat domain-containing protein [Microtetraspora sp. NBRC 13810]|uniref:HEAT repeat domain-containing protein n=1 Tax=Microtetraspora sp. NBRC 13810 TaxID=3030990 RepID=UPI002554E833|nr:HEAT repeat domain-containing protein [Microtetraspora sp. NBRC 13810]
MRRLALAVVRGERDSLDRLAGALFGVVSDDELAERALDVVAATGPEIWIDLDSALRARGYGYRDRRVSSAWAAGDNALAVALAACDRDGRERERAVAQPAMRSDVRLLPVLAIRAADWAGAVRDRALRVLADVLSRAEVAALAAVVPVAVRLRDRQRGHGVIETVREALLRADDDTLGVVRGCADLRARRFVFDVLLEAGRLDRRRLAEAALHEPDILSRTRCAEVLAAQALSRNRPDLLVELLDSASARVRVEALTALVRLGRTDLAPRFLGDEASMMRLTAQWGVRRAGGDPAELYRRRLEAPSGPGLRGLLAGLGDCGSRSDADLVLPRLDDPRPRVRAEAVRTLRRLGVPVDLAAMLEDPAPVVVRHVADTLRATGAGVPVERLWALLVTDRPRHVRLAAHRLLTARDGWTRVRADLLLIAGPDEALRDRARVDLVSWCSRHSAEASHGHCPDRLRGELADLLSAAEGYVGARTAGQLRRLLRSGTSR